MSLEEKQYIVKTKVGAAVPAAVCRWEL